MIWNEKKRDLNQTDEYTRAGMHNIHTACGPNVAHEVPNFINFACFFDKNTLCVTTYELWLLVISKKKKKKLARHEMGAGGGGGGG